MGGGMGGVGWGGEMGGGLEGWDGGVVCGSITQFIVEDVCLVDIPLSGKPACVWLINCGLLHV